MEYDVASYQGMFSEKYWFQEWLPGGAADCFLRSFARDRRAYPYLAELTGYIKSFGYRTLCSFIKKGVTP